MELLKIQKGLVSKLTSFCWGLWNSCDSGQNSSCCNGRTDGILTHFCSVSATPFKGRIKLPLEMTSSTKRSDNDTINESRTKNFYQEPPGVCMSSVAKSQNNINFYSNLSLIHILKSQSFTGSKSLLENSMFAFIALYFLALWNSGLTCLKSDWTLTKLGQICIHSSVLTPELISYFWNLSSSFV